MENQQVVYLGDHEVALTKSDPQFSFVYKLTIEYLLNQLLIEVTDEGALIEESFKKVSLKHRRFALGNVILYPVFIALSNGNSKSLFAMFSPFVYISGIPISLSLVDQLQKAISDENHFDYFLVSDENNILMFAETINSQGRSLNEVKSMMLEQGLLYNQNEFRYKECSIINDKGDMQPLYAAIDSAFAAIRKQSKGAFFDLNIQELKLQASFFNSSNRIMQDGKTFEFYEVEVESRRPYYESVV